MRRVKVLTTCVYCGVGCQLYLKVRDGKVVGIVPERIHGVNQGKLCIKGWAMHEFIHSPERLKKPLIKREGTVSYTHLTLPTNREV